jgi:hypothetical protein
MRGGYRQNSGRKEGFSAKNAEEARRILSEMVMSEIKPIGKALIAKAKKGDITAARELFDRAFGKAPQTTKIDSDSINPTPILSLLWEGEEKHGQPKPPPIYSGLSRLGTNE